MTIYPRATHSDIIALFACNNLYLQPSKYITVVSQNSSEIYDVTLSLRKVLVTVDFLWRCWALIGWGDSTSSCTSPQHASLVLLTCELCMQMRQPPPQNFPLSDSVFVYFLRLCFVKLIYPVVAFGILSVDENRIFTVVKLEAVVVIWSARIALLQRACLVLGRFQFSCTCSNIQGFWR